jgi:hypothetical protein
MNVKLKDGVYGFIWEQDGTVGEIFTEKLSDKEIELIWRVIYEDHSLIIDEDDIKDCFMDGGDIMDEDDFYEGYRLDKVMEFIK